MTPSYRPVRARHARREGLPAQVPDGDFAILPDSGYVGTVVTPCDVDDGADDLKNLISRFKL